MSAHAFFVMLGVAAALATVLYVRLMVLVWPGITSLGQRLRFLCLLYAAVQFTYGSTQLALDPDAQIHSRNFGALGFIALLIVTGVVSIYETRRAS